MKPISLQEIRQAVGGKPLAAIPTDLPPITAVCTDTRRMEKSSLFVALRGDNFNAHDFLPQAAAGGAIAALVEQVPPNAQPNVHMIQVPDTRAALGKLARHVRRQMRCKVIAVAGSNGKTSTKHLIDAALHNKLKGSVSPKSFNNDIGVPLTIFPADPMQDYLVLEMGTNHHGEIEILTEMAQPDIAVITNCSAEHLEGLDDLLGVRRENASIVNGMNDKGLLVLNGDDDELLDAASNYAGKRVTFGLKPTNDLYATDIQCAEDGVRFRLNNSRREVHVSMLGRHSAINALAAIAVARRMGLTEEAVLESLAAARGPEMRLQLQKMNGVLILNDAYNANPASMRAALETAASFAAVNRRIAVLGDMRELGKSSDRYHKEIGEFFATCSFDALVCVGESSTLVAETAIASGFAKSAVHRFAKSTEAAPVVAAMLRPGDLVLLKGSRSMQLERVAQAIAGQLGAAELKAAS